MSKSTGVCVSLDVAGISGVSLGSMQQEQPSQEGAVILVSLEDC
ncbi:hypothetical protein [Blastopirellula marina]|nr:hypothetical protein [Blastopirellula marina]